MSQLHKVVHSLSLSLSAISCNWTAWLAATFVNTH